jgi:hypothetical protein
MLAGNLASIGVGGIIAVVASYVVRQARVEYSDAVLTLSVTVARRL